MVRVKGQVWIMAARNMMLREPTAGHVGDCEAGAVHVIHFQIWTLSSWATLAPEEESYYVGSDHHSNTRPTCTLQHVSSEAGDVSRLLL